MIMTGNFFFNFTNFFVIVSFFLTKLLVSVLTNLLYSVLLRTSFFTTSLSLLKPTGTGTNLLSSNLST